MFSAGRLFCQGPKGSLELLPCFGCSQGKMSLAASPSWHHRSACFTCAPTAAFIFIHLFPCSIVLLAQVCYRKSQPGSLVHASAQQREIAVISCVTHLLHVPLLEANKLLTHSRCSCICFTLHQRSQQISFLGNAFNPTHSSINSW